ncbi:MAG: type IV secretory system conjugative DNA transfer family protein [Minisyncoccota bacterium]
MYNPEKITYFAETDSRNKRVSFGIKAKDRLKHVYVIGKTGMGKSTLLENMAVQDIKGNEGMAFIDPHGKTAELLLEYVPPERIKDVIYFAPFDTEFPISFNVMEDVGTDKRHLVANGLMSAFKKIWVDAWSARMEYILNNILLALLEYPGSTLVGVNRMLSDKSYREKVVDNIKDPSVKSFWVDEFAKYGDKYMQEAGAAIQNKIGQFISNPLVRNIIGQEKSSFDIRKIMDEGKIMIINLSKGRVGEANANLIGSMLITKIYLAAMSRADKSETELQKLPNFYLYVDEFQSFANESFADILSEARKYKLNLTIAHQYIEQMAEEVRAAVFGNVGTMITFRVGAYDAEVLEKEFAPTFTAEDLVNLGSYQIYLKLMIDGIGSQPFSARTMAPIEKPATSSMEEIIRQSRRVYASPKSEVEKKIQAWHEEGRSAPVPKAPKRDYKDFNPQRDIQKEIHRDIHREVPKPQYMPRPASEVRPAPVPKPQFVPPPKPKVEEMSPNVAKAMMGEQDNFKPLKNISLDALKQKSNNQRPASEKNVNDLKDALSSIVKKSSEPTPAPKLEASPKKLEAKKGPTPEELQSILNG